MESHLRALVFQGALVDTGEGSLLVTPNWKMVLLGFRQLWP